jgi:hypothetical protein
MMHMSSPWRRLTTPTLIDEVKEAKTAIAVARVLEGQPTPCSPEYTGSSVQDLAKHRIAEIERNYEPECYDMRDPVWLGNHHAQNAASRAESYAHVWSWNMQWGGRRNLPNAVQKMVTNLRDRIDPALHAAQREFAPSQHLQQQYNELEAAVMAHTQDIKRRYALERISATVQGRIKLHRQEGEELQRVLDDFAKGVRDWASTYPKSRDALPT